MNQLQLYKVYIQISILYYINILYIKEFNSQLINIIKYCYY